MSIAVPRCWSYVSLILVLFSSGALHAAAADQSKEIAARARLGEAEKLIECALPQEALSVLDQVKVNYPGTEAAAFAELRRAQCFFFLKRYDDAITTATRLIADNPKTVLAGWCQSILGQSLIDKGNVADGITELKKVESMLPDRKEVGPLNESREALGRVCLDYLAGRSDDLDAVEFLGMDRSNTNSKARLLAILAAYRARKGQMEAAKATLARLTTECPGVVSETTWAKIQITLLETRAAKTVKESVDTALLADTVTSAAVGDHEAARVALVLAQRYQRTGHVTEGVAVLRTAAEKFAFTGSGAEIIYQLGNALYQQGAASEALLTLNRVINDYPRSGYAAPALYCIGTHITADRSAAIDALTRLAEGGYDSMWQGLALWRLADLARFSDTSKAIGYYTRAAEIFEKSLSEQKADLGGDWQDALKQRIQIIRSELSELGTER